MGLDKQNFYNESFKEKNEISEIQNDYYNLITF